MLVGLNLLLSACGSNPLESIGNRFTLSGPCANFNDTRDGFDQDVRIANSYLNVGGGTTIAYTSSWYDNDMDRQTLNCTPDWRSSNNSAVRFDNPQGTGVTVTALQPGIVQLSAVVTGSGGTKTDSVWIAIRPLSNEQEPNNGYGFAKPLTVDAPAIGYNSTYDDVDYYYADIPAGRSYQFTLRASATPTNADPFYDTWYSGDVRHGDGTYIGEANRGYTNTTASTQRVYFIVDSSSSNTNFPYVLKLELN
ncbi:hypothetical protein [Deinococcus yavapaiensis]|nr:hypothetical protein [Deinococcus yavapaiensis]